jgi:hypothetical protein
MDTDPLFPTAALLPLCDIEGAHAATRGTSCGGWADDDLTTYTNEDRDGEGVA